MKTINLLGEASSYNWPDPTPIKQIKKELLPVMSLTPEMIPEPFREWLKDISERMQCPLDYVAVTALVTTAAIIGAGCKVRPKKHDSWAVVPNLWGGIVGRPSTLKSPSLKEVMRPLKLLEEEARVVFENEKRAYQLKMESFQVCKEAIKKKMSKAAIVGNSLQLDMTKQELEELKEPRAPVWKRYHTNDATIEKMHDLLSMNTRGLLLYRDELIGLLDTWDKEGHEADRSFYLEAWNGDDSKTTDRIGRGTTFTKNLCVSILGGTQPDKLFSYFNHTSSGFCNDGMLQRFQLLVYPDDAKAWSLVDRTPNAAAQAKAFSIIRNLSTMNFREQGAFQENEGDTPYFCFTETAQHFFYAWLSDLEKDKLMAEDEPIVIEHLAKYRKLLPSLSLLFHLILVADGKARGNIDVGCVAMAAEWCKFQETHARRIYDGGLSPGYEGARTLARKIQEGELKDNFEPRDVYRKQWSHLRNKEEVLVAFNILVDHNWIKESQVADQGKTKCAYEINPKVNVRASR
ncbi:MAG: DUF3987 domain-containing protein [Alphaproteobacteria bacterium]|nr:DUF3987 domain-containing protein [Alphaproteobacteria bacterium]